MKWDDMLNDLNSNPGNPAEEIIACVNEAFVLPTDKDAMGCWSYAVEVVDDAIRVISAKTHGLTNPHVSVIVALTLIGLRAQSDHVLNKQYPQLDVDRITKAYLQVLTDK